MTVIELHRALGLPVVRWATAVAVAALATACRLLLPIEQGALPYLLHLPATAVATWFLGVSGGLVTVLSSALFVHLAIFPGGGPPFDWNELASMAAFIGVGCALVWQVGRWRGAEQRARRTEVELRALMNAASESIWLFDRDGTILAANTTAAQRFGLRPEEMTGRPWQSFVGPDVLASRQARFEEVYRTKQPVRFEDTRAGMRFAHSFYPVLDAQGSVRAVAAYSRDITEQKRTVEELKELTQRLTYHVDHSPLAVIEWGSDMRVIRWSAAAERLFGWRADEVLGKRIEDLHWVVEEDQEAVAEVSADLATGRDTTRVSANRNYRKDGSIVFCEWYNSSLLDEHGRLRSILSLVLDVTDRKRLERELVENAEQLARANRLKDEFLATLSHELRTPINAILGWSHILTTTDIGDTMRTRGLEVIAQNATIQARLIEDVLDLSRIVTGNFRLGMQAVDAAAAIRAAVDSVRQAAAAKNLAFRVEQAPQVTLTADPARLQQVLWNLLSNAVKFTPAGGEVSVAARHAHGSFEFEVRDTGIGISPEFLPHVFERFAQADSSSTREHGGLGLGLAIVRHIVELHGGSVTAASDGPGTGATFVVRLPAGPASAG